ncbi:hypothetical protein TL16_g04108 [Triparma laevis f. inornata]|uniref:tRNA dimethylallyltransferase n=1 Tax=Triparma laevis f. inornata TaxID=1714386 RepID=A0A9W7A6K6_9STRA|nr:hypothetical protein TL16_g04108 [Triparma laevis f. inornata]
MLLRTISFRPLLTHSRPFTTLPAQKVTLITGPTSVGKTAVSVSLTNPPSLIISADSVQIYEKLSIGANKPTESELKTWNIPHKLIGLMPLHPIDTLETSTAASWYTSTLNLLKTSSPNTVICGGSSMYIDWLLNGMPNAPGWSNSEKVEDVEIDNAIKDAGFTRIEFTSDLEWISFTSRLVEVLTREGGVLEGVEEGVKVELKGKFNGVTKNDLYRLKRAVQISVSHVKEKRRGGIFENRRKEREELFEFRPFFLCPEERREHFHLIDERCEKMILRGLIDEVGNLMIEDDLANAPVARAIGYRQTIDYLTRGDFVRGDLKAFEEYLKRFKAATRQYAKQQMQWWR